MLDLITINYWYDSISSGVETGGVQVVQWTATPQVRPQKI